MQLLEIAKPHLLTVAEYMTLEIEGRTELIGGVIYDVSPRNEPHRYAVRKLAKALSVGLAPSYIVQVQDAVAVSGWHGKDAPEIDVAVLADKFYRPAPTAADAFAFIEVSDTTYSDDRNDKIPLYVHAGVPSWIVNIRLRHVELFGCVEDLELEHGRVFTDRETFEVLGIQIAVAELFENGSDIPNGSDIAENGSDGASG